MSKVIRIDAETFSRLQNIAEPLIDTPSDVIVRLLNYYESSINKNRITEQISGAHITQKETSPIMKGRNLFLAPAVDENINRTIRSSITLKEIKKFLSDDDLYKLETKSPDINILHCWAMTESRRTVYEAMHEGDFVLFTLKNSGRFEFWGEVNLKIENELLGRYLWDFTPNKPWRLIYFLRNLRAIDIEKTRLVETLSYNSSYNVPGIIKVNRINLEIAINRFGSLENMIESLQKK